MLSNVRQTSGQSERARAMYTITIHKTNGIDTITNLPLERAIVYKRRYAKRGIETAITKQECDGNACSCSWHPTRK